MIVRQLVTTLGFEVNQGQLNKADQAVATLTKGLTAVVGLATAATGALFGLARSTQSAGDEIAKTARLIGTTTDELQSLRFVAGQAGVETGTLDNALQFLNKNLAGTGKTASDVLPQLANEFASLTNEADKAALAQEYFGRSGARMVLLLEQGAEGIAEAQERFELLGGAMSVKGTANAEIMGDALDDLQTIVRGLSYWVGERLMPIVIEIAHGIRDWYIENREIIRQNIAAFVDKLVSSLRVFWSTVRRVIGIVNQVAQSMGGWESTMRLVVSLLGAMVATRVIRGVWALAAAITAAGGAMKFLGLMMLRIPHLAIMAALALVLEDLWGWTQGHESVAEYILGTWEQFAADWRELVGNLFEGRWLEALGNMDRATDEFAAKIRGYLETLLLPEWLARFMNDGGAAGALGRLREGAEGAAQLEQFPNTDDLSGVAGQQILEGAGGASVDNRQVNVTAPITIDITSGTPEEQAQRIESVVYRSLDRAINDAALNLETR
ncbi:hypothetical protein LY622_21260 [Halomonas sp. M5N1S17]|uniref:hypothetical protein n=1 Tax=Halomonas alkalisoli TaxID=2907158 RepID=UPI001F2BD22B|nr:hypothetical protein [Halomonas alkalisoli]MCE9665963.1 hypothetical protein [Halomonas alkalisoli]